MDAHQALGKLHKELGKHKTITLSAICKDLKGSLEPVFIGLISFPFLFFFTIPGLATLFGIVIGINGIRIAQQKVLYIPKFLGKRKISTSILQKWIYYIRKIIRFLHRILGKAKTRSVTPAKSLFITWLSGWLICFSGFLLAIPLPPGTNVPPAVALMMVVIGLYRKSLTWVLLGGVVFLATLVTYIFFTDYFADRFYLDFLKWKGRG